MLENNIIKFVIAFDVSIIVAGCINTQFLANCLDVIGFADHYDIIGGFVCWNKDKAMMETFRI